MEAGRSAGRALTPYDNNKSQQEEERLPPLACMSSANEIVTTQPMKTHHTSNSQFLQCALCLPWPSQVPIPPFKKSSPLHFFFFFFCLFAFSVCRGFQAKGRIGAVAAGLPGATATWDPRCICNLHHSSLATRDP